MKQTLRGRMIREIWDSSPWIRYKDAVEAMSCLESIPEVAELVKPVQVEEASDLEGKVFELSMKLKKVEHDLSHVVLERDHAQLKVDRVQKLLAGVASHRSAWYDVRDTHRIIQKAKEILRGPR